MSHNPATESTRAQGTPECEEVHSPDQNCKSRVSHLLIITRLRARGSRRCDRNIRPLSGLFPVSLLGISGNLLKTAYNPATERGVAQGWLFRTSGLFLTFCTFLPLSARNVHHHGLLPGYPGGQKGAKTVQNGEI